MRIVIGVFIALQFSMPVTNAQEQSAGSTAATASSEGQESARDVPANHAIDFSGFVKLTGELQHVRDSRRVPIAAFSKMADDPDTIVLDTRSKWAFDLVHVAGAVHLNFSDFTDEKLREVIPSKTTRILIYCNNNFREPSQGWSEPSLPRSSPAPSRQGVVEGFTNKLPRLALNIPTFITLFGYGYENVYELADQLELDDTRLKLAGTGDFETATTGFDPRR